MPASVLPVTRRSVTASDGVRLHVEATGTGAPLVFVHEFAADHRSWEPQVRHFSRMYTAVTFSARGYPPSDVPADPAAYSQSRAAADIGDVMTALGFERAHVVSFSMGAFAGLQFALEQPQRCLSLVLAGVGYGSPLDRLAHFRAEALAAADMFERIAMTEAAFTYGQGPARVQFQGKDPRGWAEFVEQLGGHDPRGAALTMRGVQARRPSIYEFDARLAACEVPTLIVVGDEDEPALDPSLHLKRTMPCAGLTVFPRTGHTINLEEPAMFNEQLATFLHTVGAGGWRPRDPRSRAAGALGVGR